MASSNPYAPPQHDDFGTLPMGSAGSLRLLGDTLTCDKGASLPRICLFSGEAGDARISRKLSWAPQWFIAVAALSPLLGAILYFIVRKTGDLEYSLSTAAKERSRSALWIGVGGGVGSLLLMIVVSAAGKPEIGLVLLLLGLIAIVVGSVRGRLFTVSRIDKQQIHLKLRPDAVRAFERYLAGRG